MKFLTKIPKWLRQLLIAEIIVMVTVALAFLPAFLPNGVEKYTGKEREAAEDILKNFDTRLHDRFPRFYLKLRVSNVQAMPAEWSKNYCKNDSMTAYTVTVVDETIFGIPQHNQFDLTTCLYN